MTMERKQKISYWDVARVSKVPGAIMRVEIDPTQWTVRTRNAVKHMLSNGVIIGGYSSVTAVLAKAVAKQFDVPTTKLNGYGHIRAEYLTDKQIEAIDPLLDADLVCSRMAGMGPSRARHTEATKQKLRRDKSISYYFENTAYAKELRPVLALTMGEEAKEKAKKACAAIDAGEVIYINPMEDTQHD